jgi:hypothetical protein
MNLEIGLKYKIKCFTRIPPYWNSKGHMDEWMGRLVTIDDIWGGGGVKIVEDKHKWTWREIDFELNEMFSDEDFEL